MMNYFIDTLNLEWSVSLKVTPFEYRDEVTSIRFSGSSESTITTVSGNTPVGLVGNRSKQSRHKLQTKRDQSGQDK